MVMNSGDKQSQNQSQLHDPSSAVETVNVSHSHGPSRTVETVVMHSDNEAAKDSVVVVDSELFGRGSKQLIRMSAENVVTETATRGGWFWSKKSPEHSAKTKTTSSTGTRPNGPNSDKTTTKSSARHKEPSAAAEKRGMLATDAHGSFVSGKGYMSDVSSLSSSDVENMHDRPRFSKQSSLDSPVTSTPVRGAEKHVEGNPTRQVSSSSTKSPVHVAPNSPLSHAFDLPETSIKMRTATAAHTASFVSSQSEAESAARDVVTSPHATSQNSTVSTVFDESRYEMLLREKAGLEGRLEVMERENGEMLQQQAELKQRAAVAEKQVKVFMSTSHALNTDRNAMAVDLETLRQNRSRLEAVIVDAHKLLEEKEQEVHTLERDLELARLAGEKHLEKVADVRREATSRDATIHDLKVKITELYVQSQTSDQSRQVVEGELAAVRADIASLMEAKEWYANQLRTTQKDRTRLQQETAAARAETITSNVASERLRAENARIKRNLAEVEQRVLTEKQTLARHLEEIEADMVAREAALAVQLRHVNEASDAPTLGTSSSQDENEELSCLKAELERNGEWMETLHRENVELSRRLALSQQCVFDRDETVKSLERDRETAELRAEAAEQDVALRSADVQRLESERSELQLQLDSAGKERAVIDQSLQTLRRDAAVLETSFRRMQQDLASKTAEVEKLSSLQKHRSEDRLSEVWPDTEAAAGLKTSKEVPNSATDATALTKTVMVDKEIQSDDIIDSIKGLPDAVSVQNVTTETQTSDSTVAVVTDRAEKSLKVDSVVLQSDVISPELGTASEVIVADTGSRIIEQPQKLTSNDQALLELVLSDRLQVIDRLNEELSNVKACLSKAEAELEVANRHRQALELEKSAALNKGGDGSVESYVLNTREDVVSVSPVSTSAGGGASELARVHVSEKSNVDGRREVPTQTDSVFSHADELELRQKVHALELQLTALQGELDAAVDQKLRLETAKAAVDLEASVAAEKLCELERQSQRSQDDMVRLQRQLSEANVSSLEVHNNAVQRLENDKLSLQSQLDELTHVHNKDVSRLKSKVCCQLSKHWR